MPDISIQLHATRDELLTFARDVAKEFNATIVAMRFFPFDSRLISPQQIEDLQDLQIEYERFAFSLQSPVLPADGGLDFSDKNPDCLRMDIGAFNEDGLRESWLVARTENDSSFGVWEKVAKRLKKMTRAGVTGINRQNGVMAFYRSHRYSEGAKLLEDGGTPMLPSHGPQGPMLRIGDVTKSP